MGLFCLAGVLAGAAWAADPLGQAVDATLNANKADKASQQKVDGLDDATRAMLDRYRNALWQTQQLNVYAQQLEQLAGSQTARSSRWSASSPRSTAPNASCCR